MRQHSQGRALPQGTKCADTSTLQAPCIPHDPTHPWQDSQQERVHSPRGQRVPKGQLQQPPPQCHRHRRNQTRRHHQGQRPHRLRCRCLLRCKSAAAGRRLAPPSSIHSLTTPQVILQHRPGNTRHCATRSHGSTTCSKPCLGQLQQLDTVTMRRSHGSRRKLRPRDICPRRVVLSQDA
jgi:hypothetical protein